MPLPVSARNEVPRAARKVEPSSYIRLDDRVIRIFGEGDISPKQENPGWANAEAAHVWNDGVDCSLVVVVGEEALSSTLILNLVGRPFLNNLKHVQDMTLYVNGFRIGFWRFDEDKAYSLRAVIEPEQSFRRSGSGVLKCVWHLPTSVRPIDVQGGDDHRRLGFCFQSVMLECSN